MRHRFGRWDKSSFDRETTKVDLENCLKQAKALTPSLPQPELILARNCRFQGPQGSNDLS